MTFLRRSSTSNLCNVLPSACTCVVRSGLLRELRVARLVSDPRATNSRSSRALHSRVHHVLGDAFVVEVEDLLPEVHVLQEPGPALTHPERVLVVGDGEPLASRQDRSLVAGNLMGLTPGRGGDRCWRRCVDRLAREASSASPCSLGLPVITAPKLTTRVRFGAMPPPLRGAPRTRRRPRRVDDVVRIASHWEVWDRRPTG